MRRLKKKKISNKIIKERSFKSWNLEKRSNLDNLNFKYKTEGKIPKDFRNEQNPEELFEK